MLTNWINQSTKQIVWLDEDAVLGIVGTLESQSSWHASANDLLNIVASNSNLIGYTPDVVIREGAGAYYCEKFVPVPASISGKVPPFLSGALRSAVFKVKKLDTEDNNPRVTISISTFNREESCAKAVKSVLQQTYQNIRCLVVKDGPGEYKSLPVDPRLEFHALPRTGKYPENAEKRWHIAGVHPFNYANALTEGPILCFLDDDDIYLPDHIETIVEEWLRSRAHIIYTESNTGDNRTPFDFDFDRERLERENFMFSCTTAYCGSALTLAFTPPYAEYPADWTALRRMSEAGLKFKKVKKITSVHGDETPTRLRKAYIKKLKSQQDSGD